MIKRARGLKPGQLHCKGDDCDAREDENKARWWLFDIDVEVTGPDGKRVRVICDCLCSLQCLTRTLKNFQTESVEVKAL